jgi:hypothetical protein
VLSVVVPAMEIREAHQQVEVESHRQLVEDGHSMLPRAFYRFVKDQKNLEHYRVAEEQQYLKCVQISQNDDYANGVDPPNENQGFPVHSHPCLQPLVSDDRPIALCESGSDKLPPSLTVGETYQNKRGDAAYTHEAIRHDR